MKKNNELVTVFRLAANTEPRVKKVLEVLAAKQRLPPTVMVDHAIGWIRRDNEGYSFDAAYRAVRQTFRLFELHGLGTYVQGRHGHPSRLVLKASGADVRALATSALMPSTALRPDVTAQPEATAVPASPDVMRQLLDQIQARFSEGKVREALLSSEKLVGYLDSMVDKTEHNDLSSLNN